MNTLRAMHPNHNVNGGVEPFSPMISMSPEAVQQQQQQQQQQEQEEEEEIFDDDVQMSSSKTIINHYHHRSINRGDFDDNNNNNNSNNDHNSNSNNNNDGENLNGGDRRNHSANYLSFIKKSDINKNSFEINGRHKEKVQCIDNFYFVRNIKFPDCVIRNLSQTLKYQGIPWFKYHPNHHNHHGSGENQYYHSIFEKIHVELNDFYNFVKPLKADEILRKVTFLCISDSIKKLKIVKQVKFYGSYSSKTYLPVSDIDLVVYCNIPSHSDELNVLFTIAERLSYDGIIEGKFNIIPLSRIPLLKFYDSLTGFPINITLNTPHVMERSHYLREHIKIDSHQMKILFFLKYYLLSKGTNQVFLGGIGSYSLALMVIRFFQEESAKELIRNKKIYQNSILGYLLMGFLERFGDVNFFKNHIISVQDEGGYIQCDYGYGRNPNTKVSILRIKDHIEPWNDVSYGSFNSAEILKDFQYLHDTFMLTDKSRRNSILGQVLFVVDSFLEYRNLLLFLFGKWFGDDDYPANYSESATYKIRFREFQEKRMIFAKTNLLFHQICLENKSLEFKIENRSPKSYKVFQDYEHDNDNHRRRNPSYHRTYENRNYSNNHVHRNGGGGHYFRLGTRYDKNRNNPGQSNHPAAAAGYSDHRNHFGFQKHPRNNHNKRSKTNHNGMGTRGGRKQSTSPDSGIPPTPTPPPPSTESDNHNDNDDNDNSSSNDNEIQPIPTLGSDGDERLSNNFVTSHHGG